MTALPEDFTNRMKELLKDDYQEFINSFNERKTSGLRINTLKASIDEFLKVNPFKLSPIPWCKEGFYYDEEIDKPGRHPLHYAGVYYIQEPSAMAVAPLLDVQEGDVVLDLCSAPGGKSTYIAAKLRGRGLLVSNEIHPQRVRILGENIERLGASNVIITNDSGDKLERVFKGFFNKILVDAPCSGEGMFRKDEVAIKDWSLAKIEDSVTMQSALLENAYEMLQAGGLLVYSTCTFSREENEEMIEAFLKTHTDMEGISMKRLRPHKIKGEGHFVAVLRKNSSTNSNVRLVSNKTNSKDIAACFDFLKASLTEEGLARLPLHLMEIRGEDIYLVPEIYPEMKEIRRLRVGLHLGTLKKNRFEPSHSLSHFLNKEDVINSQDLSFNSQEAIDYLKGNIIATGKSRGWLLVTAEGFPLGWGKEVDGVIKNHYPKGLRIKGNGIRNRD